MSIANWKPDLSVGIESLDADHQGLIDLMNDIFNSILMGEGAAVTRDAILALDGYASDHFRREEDWLKANPGPDLAEHLQEHQTFRDRIQDLRIRLDSGGEELSLEVLVFLRDWLLGHIQYSDRNAIAMHQKA